MAGGVLGRHPYFFSAKVVVSAIWITPIFSASGDRARNCPGRCRRVRLHYSISPNLGRCGPFARRDSPGWGSSLDQHEGVKLLQGRSSRPTALVCWLETTLG